MVARSSSPPPPPVLAFLHFYVSQVWRKNTKFETLPKENFTIWKWQSWEICSDSRPWMLRWTSVWHVYQVMKLNSGFWLPWREPSSNVQQQQEHNKQQQRGEPWELCYLFLVTFIIDTITSSGQRKMVWMRELIFKAPVLLCFIPFFL